MASRTPTLDLERAAQTALETLQALGYQGPRMDLAVRGECVDCASGMVAATGAQL